MRSQIRDRKIRVQRPFGFELRRKCRKTECFEGEETDALPQSFYCTFTAIRRKCLIMSGAGEGNRTLVSVHIRNIIVLLGIVAVLTLPDDLARCNFL